MLHKFCKGIFTVITTIAALFVSSPFVFAAEAIPVTDSNSKVLFTVIAMLGAGLVMGVGAVGVALGIGSIGNAACNAVGRNPGGQGKIMMTMMVGMAMAESIAIYCLVIALALLYANPYMRYFLG